MSVVRMSVIKLILSQRFRLSVVALVSAFSLLNKTTRGESACSVTRIVCLPGTLDSRLSGGTPLELFGGKTL